MSQPQSTRHRGLPWCHEKHWLSCISATDLAQHKSIIITYSLHTAAAAVAAAAAARAPRAAYHHHQCQNRHRHSTLPVSPQPAAASLMTFVARTSGLADFRGPAGHHSTQTHTHTHDVSWCGPLSEPCTLRDELRVKSESRALATIIDRHAAALSLACCHPRATHIPSAAPTPAAVWFETSRASRQTPASPHLYAHLNTFGSRCTAMFHKQDRARHDLLHHDVLAALPRSSHSRCVCAGRRVPQCAAALDTQQPNGTIHITSPGGAGAVGGSLLG